MTAILVGALLLLTGRTDLPRVWLVAGVIAAGLMAAVVFIDPATTRERLKRGQKTADPTVLLLLRVFSSGTVVLGALDVGRLHWGDTVPAPVSLAAAAALAAAFALALLAIRVNRFFVPVVRIQTERGHHVVDQGPYRLVRHPGYAAMMVFPPAMALTLGSWVALLPGLSASLVFVVRAAREDAFLKANLPGYAEYATRTRYRLVPGLWMLLIAVAGLVAAAAPAPARAQDTTRTPPRPFVEGGQYDRPYLTRLLGRTAIGGYAEAHARLERVDGATDEAGFQAKRWNIFTATQVSDFVRIGAELEFEDGAQEIKLEYAAIDIGIHPAVSVRAGMLLSPLGKFNLAHDSPRNEFVDRPSVSTELLGVALSEPGLGLFGLFPMRGGARLTYELYAVNGFHAGLIDRSPEGTRIAQGRGNFEDNNSSPAFVGRVAFSPRVGVELGLSSHRGAYNVYQEEGLPVDDRRDVAIWVLDAEATALGVRLMGEAAMVSVGVPPGLEGIYASRQRGFYLQAVRPFWRGRVATMPESHFAMALRLDVVDFDAELPGDMLRQGSVGLNFRPTADTVLKLDWVRGRTRDRFNNPSDHARLLFSAATYF